MSLTKSPLDEILETLDSLDSYTLVRTGAVSDRYLIGLDSNENYFADADFLRRIAEEAARCDFRRYPRQELVQLSEMLGAWLRVEPECIVLSNGGDELIDLAATMLLRRGSAVTIEPTYSLYDLRIKLAGGKLIKIALKRDFSLDVPSLVSAADASQSSIIFLCSPNNPTGNQFSEADIVEVLRRFPGLVLLDEAYAEFAERSFLPLTQKYANLAVIRTFSKAFGIAGARLGYMVANPRLSKPAAEKLQLPYPVSKFAARLGMECLRNLKAMEDGVSKLKQERRWLIGRLRQIEGLTAFDSEANFVLVCTGQDSALICAKLRSLGISVKNIGDVLDLRGCLRVTVGTRPMNEKLLTGLEQVMSNERL